MKSIEQWTRELAEVMQLPVQDDGSRSVVVPRLNGLTVEDLEDIGLDWNGESASVRARCRCCGERYELDGEFATEDWDQSMSYCGGNQYCIP